MTENKTKRQLDTKTEEEQPSKKSRVETKDNKFESIFSFSGSGPTSFGFNLAAPTFSFISSSEKNEGEQDKKDTADKKDDKKEEKSSFSFGTSSWPSFSDSPSTFSFTSGGSSLKLGETITFPTFSIGADLSKNEGKESTIPSLDIPSTDFSSFSSNSETAKNLTQVETHTGEEGEKVEVEVRVKLFEFVKVGENSSWKERGAGPLRILFNPTSNRYRLVMRTDNAIRVVLNALPYSDMRIEKPNDKQLRFTCINTVDSSNKMGNFWIKLMNAADTTTLSKALEKAKTQSKKHEKEPSEDKETKETPKAEEKTPEAKT